MTPINVRPSTILFADTFIKKSTIVIIEIAQEINANQNGYWSFIDLKITLLSNRQTDMFELYHRGCHTHLDYLDSLVTSSPLYKIKSD